MFIDKQQHHFLLQFLTTSSLSNKRKKIVQVSSIYLKEAFGKKFNY